MYLLAFNVKTNNNEFNLKCTSKRITVKLASSSLPTYKADPSLTSEPNYIIKYDGTFSSIVPDEVTSNMYNYMAKYGVSVVGIKAYRLAKI